MSEPSSALTRRNHELARRDDVSVSTAPISFGSEVFEWSDLPSTTVRLARRSDPVLAERVVEDGGLYQTPLGLVQVLRAWRAHPGAVVMAVVQRPVVVKGDELIATGRWAHSSLTTTDAAATPRRRAGVVASAVLVEHEQVAGTGSPAPHHAAASHAWSYLPAAVRKSAERAVPVPDSWVGDLRQLSEAGEPVSQEILVLRRSTSAAAVVVARRGAPEMVGATTDEVRQRLAHEPWSVELITYDLREPAQLGPSLPREKYPWE